MPFTPASTLFVAWTILNLLLNVRYPALEPPAFYFLPSLDATLVLAGIAVLVWRGYRLPRAGVVAFAVLVVIVRAFRIGDGIVWRYFNRPFDVGLDLPTAGEIVRLMRSTVATPLLVLGAVLLVAAAVAFGALAAWSVRAAERSFASPRQRLIFVGAAALAVLLSPLVPADGRGLRAGLFAPSVVPRLYGEGKRALALDDYRRAEAAKIHAAAARVSVLPHGLEKLNRSHVLLFFIESYGAIVLEHPEMVAGIGAIYRDLEGQLTGQGFSVASSLLDSPTYGGRSQLAHQALATGVRADNRVNDALVQEIRPKTIARFFGEAGYRSILVMPGNTHRNLYRWVYDFDQLYASWDLGYQGPAFGFASMPDQYVVDFIHRREVATTSRPLLVTYALLSSHAPWDPQAPFIPDWSRLGDGRIFQQVAPVRFPINWSNLHQGAAAYLHSVRYSLQVVASYLGGFDLGDALVIVVGDHQPVADITRGSRSNAVPIHVISRQAALVDAFRARGYNPGMRPPTLASPPGMETFLPNFLADFSSGLVHSGR